MKPDGLSKNSRLEVEAIIKRDIEILSKSIHEKITWFSNSFDERMNRREKLNEEKWESTVLFRKSMEENIDKLTKSVNNITTASHVRQGFVTLAIALPGAILAVYVIIQYLK